MFIPLGSNPSANIAIRAVSQLTFPQGLTIAQRFKNFFNFSISAVTLISVTFQQRANILTIYCDLADIHIKMISTYWKIVILLLS